MNSDVNFKDLGVLVVDDEMFMRTLVRRLLSEVGVVGENIEFAGNGMEAAKALKNPERTYGLILLDLEMPGVDGFKFLDYLRSQKKPEISQLPVVVLTGHKDKGSVVKAAKIGIQGYVVKPVSRETLEKRIVAALSPGKDGEGE